MFAKTKTAPPKVVNGINVGDLFALLGRTSEATGFGRLFQNPSGWQLRRTSSIPLFG